MLPAIQVGIDLGTTRSCVVVGKEVILIHDDNPTIPSVVRVRSDGTSWSIPTGSQVEDEGWVLHLRSAKRLVGRTSGDGRLERDVTDVPHAELGGHGAVFKVGTAKIYPEEVSAFLCAMIKAVLCQLHDTTAITAVIGIPAYFGTAQKNATRDAARMAGLDNIQLIEEPVAVAIEFTFSQSSGPPADYLLVVDIGGGTTDVAVVHSKTTEHGNHNFIVKSSAGNNYLGGNDVDSALQALVKKKLKAQDVDIANIDEPKLRLECESKKRTMSNPRKMAASFEVHFSSLRPPEPVRIERAEFDNECKSVFSGLRNIIDMAVAPDSTMRKDIKQVVLTGGSVVFPFVKDMCVEMFQGIPVSYFNTQEAVARGAGRMATAQNINILPVLPQSIGLEAWNSERLLVNELMGRNTQLPYTVEHTFHTKLKHQREVDIKIFEGGNEESHDNTLLGEFTISEIPPTRKGTAITTTTTISQDFIPSVTAKIKDIQEQLIVKPVPQFTPEEFEACKQRTADRVAGNMDLSTTNRGTTTLGLGVSAEGGGSPVVAPNTNDKPAAERPAATREESGEEVRLNDHADTDADAPQDVAAPADEEAPEGVLAADINSDGPSLAEEEPPESIADASAETVADTNVDSPSMADEGAEVSQRKRRARPKGNVNHREGVKRKRGNPRNWGR
ncbi:heat shock cognate HSP70 protein [Ilyonectria robusta]